MRDFQNYSIFKEKVITTSRYSGSLDTIPFFVSFVCDKSLEIKRKIPGTISPKKKIFSILIQSWLWGLWGYSEYSYSWKNCAYLNWKWVIRIYHVGVITDVNILSKSPSFLLNSLLLNFTDRSQTIHHWKGNGIELQNMKEWKHGKLRKKISKHERRNSSFLEKSILCVARRIKVH